VNGVQIDWVYQNSGEKNLTTVSLKINAQTSWGALKEIFKGGL
jgi:hypothetical protein